MLVNPDIERWFANLQGQRVGAGGSAPRGGGLPNYGAAALEGIVKPGTGMFGFNAPAMGQPPPLRSRPTPIAPNPAERYPAEQVVPIGGGGGGARDLGGGAKAAGLEKLGAGIEAAMKTLAAKRQAAQQAQDLVKPYLAGAPAGPGAAKPGVTTPAPGPQPNLTPPAPTFPPVGPAGAPPVFTQPGALGTQPVPPIGAAGAALPTFAQAAPADQMAKYREAIAAIESRGSGDYAAVGPVTKSGDRAYGRYQVMGNNIPAWTKAATGTAMTPEQFLADKGAQEAVFNHVFGGYVRQYGPQGAANAWFTGKPNPPATARDVTGTTAPEYLRRFNAAVGEGALPPLNAPSAAAYAAAPPSLIEPTAPRLAGPAPTPDTSSQPVIPGQTDPHKPGFDPSAVPFHRTPEMGPAPVTAPPPGPAAVAAPPPPPAAATEAAGPRQITPGQPQTGPAYSDETWTNRPRYDYGGGAASVPVPPPPGQQSMNDQTNRLAAALAQAAPDQTPQLDQSALLAMALSQPTPDFGGFGGTFG